MNTVKEEDFNTYFNSLLLISKINNPGRGTWWHIDNVIGILQSEDEL